MNRFRWLLAGLVMLATQGGAMAWEPAGPVEIVVAAGPGGGNDRTARLVAKVLAERKLVSNPLVVINKPGAGGVIAQNYLNANAGSGNHLMITNPAIVTNALMGMGKASYTDVTPVAQLFTEYVVLITRPGSDLADGRQLLERLRKSPGALTLGVAPAVGAGTHIGAALAFRNAGIDPTQLRVIPYSTSGDVMTALMGGHIDLMASTPINVLPQLQNRTVRPLAITSRKRMGGNLAGVPTFSELGAETEFGNWRGLVGPRGMRPEQLAYWQQVFTKLVATPEWQAELASQLSDDQFMGPADSAKFLNDEHQRLGRILRDLGLAK